MSLEFVPSTDFLLLLLVPLIPLAGYALQIALRRRWPWGDKVLTAGMGAVMGICVYMAAKALYAAHQGMPLLAESRDHGWAFHWLFASLPLEHPLNLGVGILFDPLGAAMLAVVGIVSFCVHLYSIGYMHGDKRYNIFFANISLFTFAMLGLVLADSLLFLFVFWELMGLMSYLLIGHFAHDPGNPFFHRWATWASKKAFLTTRVGDVCLLVGLLMFYDHFGTFRITELWEAARATVAANGGEYPAWMTAAGLLIFGGTVGKSAQFPLHVWLPDAMAGPTPVSAMIHAATMVAAGVFLLGRTYPLMSPEVLTIVTVVGAFTALFAATIGCTAWDLKAVLAWSTISQLGFMVAAIGLGGVVAGTFHMVTHAFFKACLFLSAGSVIHGCHHEQDMRRMGGLRRHMPLTYASMLLSTLAIAGVPFFSGFYSKDMILAAGWEGIMERFSGANLFALIALALGAVLTAFYMFRLIFLTFHGEYQGVVVELHGHGYGAEAGEEGVGHEHGPEEDQGHHALHLHADEPEDEIAHGHGGTVPHESPWPMTAALLILAALGVLGGHFWLADFAHPGHLLTFWHATPWYTELATFQSMYGQAVGDWLRPPLTDHQVEVAHLAHNRAVLSSLLIVAVGIGTAWFLYVRRRDLPGRISRGLGLVYQTVRDRYYVDEVIDGTAVRGTLVLSAVQTWIDKNVVDGLVNAVGRANRMLGFVSAAFDRVVIDGAVNAVALVSQAFGAVFRLLQTGRIQQYAAFAVAGALLLSAWLILA